MSKYLRAVVVAVVILVVSVTAIRAFGSAPPPDHIRSWTAAVDQNLIEGDPAYYYNGQATPAEYAHAVIVALLAVDAGRYVTPGPASTLDQPASFCAHRLWEYRDTPGAGYMAQGFADDSQRYESIVMFHDLYAPVVYLMPQMGRIYQHPAGGYAKLVVCWSG